MEKIEVSVDTLNKVLQHLSSRPYAEVAQLIAEIQSQAPAQPAPDVKTKDKDQ